MSIRATGGRASSALLAFMVCAGASLVHGQQVYHVDDDARAGGDGLSWNRAFQDLQDALAIATSGDEVWVAAGTYEPSVPSFRTATFSIPSGVRVYGGFDGTEASLGDRGDPFDNVSVLDGFIGPGQRVYSVVTFDGTDAATTLDGFRIIRGEANSTGENETSDGGGVYMTQAAATLRNLRIENNDATLDGGGLSIRDGRQDELTIIEDCVFEGNACAADGGALAFDAPVEIRGSTFQNNTAGERGGAVFDNNPGITVISDSEFRFNEVNPTPGASGLTGAYFIERDSGQVTMSSCLFIGNRAPEDGAVSIVGNGLYEFLGCRFYGNVSESPDPTVSQAGGAINLR
ncbi:MAG: right-handed parallel beta-helix repeat-containing protein, partial [Planctomycetota bacterium]